jgi:hypothetical protein
MQFYGRSVTTMFASLLVFGSLCSITGCERKEKVLDIETPNGNIEVERSTGTGKVDVDIDVDKNR